MLYSYFLIFFLVTNGGEQSQVSCGENYTLAWVENKLYGWGDNRFGQIDSSSVAKNFSVPKLIELEFNPGDSCKRIYCGWSHSTILTGVLFVGTLAST